MTTLNISKLSMAGFAFPAMPLAAFIQAMYFFLTPLYAVEMGLGTAAVGGIFFAAKMWDVVTDPVFGVVSDKFPTRWGRRRPWLVLGMIVMVIAIYMLFMPKDNVGASYFLGWLVFMYVG
ncbi:MAG: MFS transporter, partial [Gammaproteobacteria bacterium]|nr:MFS transporter [Gammaproteobacteria bacterium]